jgi:anti-sigma factor RsiW
MACNETLNTQSLFDSALQGDAARAAERHVETCAECTQLLVDLATTQRAVRGADLYYRADPTLRARVEAAINRERDAAPAPAARTMPWRRPFWMGAFGGSFTTALAAAAVVFFLVVPPETDALVADVTSAHIRSLVGTHLLDVNTADPRVAQDWLASHAGLTFKTAAPQGYQLVGARSDYLYESGAAVAVYKKGRRIVNVFAWTERENEELPETASHDGYNVVFWKHGNVVFCAVSNLPASDLQKFARAA